MAEFSKDDENCFIPVGEELIKYAERRAIEIMGGNNVSPPPDDEEEE
jgi:hypothetical protein